MDDLERFQARIVVDEHFISSIFNREDTREILTKMSYVHKKSKDYQFEHNKILDPCFKQALDQNNIGGDVILGAMSAQQVPDFIDDTKNKLSKVIKYSISLAAKDPYTTFIFTSKEKQEEYEENQHYKEVSGGVKIADVEDAIQFIDNLHPKVSQE